MMETDGIEVVHGFQGRDTTICDRDNKSIKKGFFVPVDIMKEAEARGFDNRGACAGRLIAGALVYSLCDSCTKEFLLYAPDKAFTQPA
jgi:hypothetical protein